MTPPQAPERVELLPASRFEWERIIRRASLSKAEKLLALVIASYADPDGTRIRPGTALLAADTGDSVRQVQRILSRLLAHGLVEMVRRGGGRGGRGRAHEYRLTLPEDLIERGLLRDLPATAAVSPDTQMSGETPVDKSDSPDIQMSGHSYAHPVDKSDSPDIQMSGESGRVDPIDRTSNTVTDRLTGHFEPFHRTSGCPTTNHIDQPHRTNHQSPPSAPTDRARSESTENSSTPDRCEHGLAGWTRPDGTPACALCRRGARASGPVVALADYVARRAAGGAR